MTGARLICALLFALAFLPAFASAEDDGVKRVTIEGLKSMMERGAPVTILDVRSKGSYDSSKVRIKGSVRIPLGELSDRAGELPSGRPVVAYCT